MHQTTEVFAPADCPVNGTAATQSRMQRARRTRHQARLIQDGRILAAGPWRSDHLAAVVDRRRITDYMTDHGVAGKAEISTMIEGGAS